MPSMSLRSIVILPTLRVKSSRAPLAEASKSSPALLPLKSIVSVPSWPSTVSLPSPGSHWNVSSPAPSSATSFPWLPSAKSLPSPPSRRSTPLLPRSVSLPAPPSTVILMRVARSPVAEKLSSPPFALTTRFSEVPMSIANGAGSTRSNRTRMPFAVAVNCSAPLPPLTSTVSTPPPPSLRSVSSPGFQIIRSLSLWPKAWSSASPPVRVSFSPPPNSRSVPPLPRSVSLPAWPNSWSAPAPPVRTSLPAPPNRFARGRAPFVSLRLITSLSPRPKTRISAVLATVGVPPPTGTAPPLTRMSPAALRLMSMLLAAAVAEHGECPVVERCGGGCVRGPAGRGKYAGSEHDAGEHAERRASRFVVMSCGHRSPSREQPAVLRARAAAPSVCAVSEPRTPPARRNSRCVGTDQDAPF